MKPRERYPMKTPMVIRPTKSILRLRKFMGGKIRICGGRVKYSF